MGLGRDPARTRRGRLAAAAACAAAVVLAGGVAVGATSAPSTAAPWRAVATFPASALSMGAVACPSATECVAAATAVVGLDRTQFGELLVTHDGGARWTPARVRASAQRDGDLQDVACASPTTCLAVGTEWTGGVEGRSFGGVLRSTDGGATWAPSPAPLGAVDLDAATCGPTVCAVVGTSVHGDAFLATTPAADAGAHWAIERLPAVAQSPDDVACPTAATCVVAADHGSLFNAPTTGVLATTVDLGAHWSVARLPAAQVDHLVAISCPTAQRCLAAGEEWHLGSGGEADLVGARAVSSTDAGRTWRVTGRFVDASDVACATSTRCELVGSTSPQTVAHHGLAGAWRTDDLGATWRRQPLPHGVGPLSGVDCLTARRCEAVGETYGTSTETCLLVCEGGADIGAALGTSDGGARWRGQGLQFGADVLTAASCPTTSTCQLAADDVAAGHGALYGTDDGGLRWAREPVPADQSSLTGVLCPTPRFCLAEGVATIVRARPPGVVLFATHDGGARWTQVFADHAAAEVTATCPAVDRCDVVVPMASERAIADGRSARYRLASTTDGGRTWRLAGLPDDVVDVDAVSCPAPGHCDVLAEGGGWLLSTADGGRTWRRHDVPRTPYEDALRCATPRDCVVTGSLLLVTTDGGRSWTRHAEPRPRGWRTSRTVCASADRCVEVVGFDADPSGAVHREVAYATTDGFRTVRVAQLPTLPQLSGLACTPGLARCYAIGSTLLAAGAQFVAGVPFATATGG